MSLDDRFEVDERAIDGPANKDVSVRKPKRELSFDGKVADLYRFIHFEPLIRELDYKVLVYCSERRELHDVEEHMAVWPEFHGATRDQYHLIMELVDHHGLEFIELDEAGQVVTDADKDGLSENEIDDKVVAYAYKTTDVGRAVTQRMDPARRIAELLEAAPAQRSLYLDVIGYLRTKHSFADVDVYVRALHASELSRKAGDGGIQPSVFVDKLERAGALFYDRGWQATAAGVKVWEEETKCAPAGV